MILLQERHMMSWFYCVNYIGTNSIVIDSISIRVRELLMGFQDVAFLLCQARFPPHFLNCGRCECLGTTICHITVVGGEQGYAPCKILLLQQSLFLCPLNFMEIIRLSQS